MPELVTTLRHTKAEAGRIGAERRWGPRRVIRLDSLSPEARRLVLALVAAAEGEGAASAMSPDAATPEVRRGIATPAD